VLEASTSLGPQPNFTRSYLGPLKVVRDPQRTRFNPLREEFTSGGYCGRGLAVGAGFVFVGIARPPVAELRHRISRPAIRER
jgi:hypothetical protein